MGAWTPFRRTRTTSGQAQEPTPISYAASVIAVKKVFDFREEIFSTKFLPSVVSRKEAYLISFNGSSLRWATFPRSRG